MSKTKKELTSTVTIQPPNIQRAKIRVRGTAPYCQNRFGAKAKQILHEAQEAGKKKAKQAKDPKDFEQAYLDAMYVSDEGWNGIPAPAFRNAMVSACRVAGFPMTRAKLSIFVEADGFDREEGTPLVRLLKGSPKYHEAAVRNASGVVDLRARPLWDPGWEADVRLQWDGDQFTVTDVTNLLLRAGLQVGIGEGRPDSKSSCGLGWGTFEIVSEG